LVEGESAKSICGKSTKSNWRKFFIDKRGFLTRRSRLLSKGTAGGIHCPNLLLLALSYLRAAAALIVAVAAVGAAPGWFFVAAVATSGGTFVVLVFFVGIGIVAVEVAHVARPRAETLGRRLVREGVVFLLFLLLHLLSRGETIPGEAVVVAFLLRLPNGEEAKVALPVR
jgi:hypothetical protein